MARKRRIDTSISSASMVSSRRLQLYGDKGFVRRIQHSAERTQGFGYFDGFRDSGTVFVVTCSLSSKPALNNDLINK